MNRRFWRLAAHSSIQWLLILLWLSVPLHAQEFPLPEGICLPRGVGYSGLALLQASRIYGELAPINAEIQEKYLRALESYLRDNELPVPDAMAYYLGLAVYAQRRWSEALQIFQQEMGPWSAMARAMAAACLYHLRRMDEYERVFQDLPEPLKGICLLRIHLERPQGVSGPPPEGLGAVERWVWRCISEGLDHLTQEALDRVPWGKPEHWETLGDGFIYFYNPLTPFYLKDIFLQKAVQLLSEARPRRGYCLASALADQGRFQEGLDIVDEMRERFGGDPVAVGLLGLLRARCLLGLNRREDAIQTLRQFSQLSRTLTLAKIRLLLKEGLSEEDGLTDLEEASAALNAPPPRGCEEAPHSPIFGLQCNDPCREWRWTSGLAYLKAGRASVALRHLRSVFSLPNACNQSFRCHPLAYLLTLLRAEYQSGQEMTLKEIYLNQTVLTRLAPELRQTAMALQWIEDMVTHP